MVAKTYQGLPFVGEVYTVGKNSYINVLTKKGIEKRVRWYSIDEYCKMYPSEDREKLLRENDPYWKPLKNTLMGKLGYIYVVYTETLTTEDLRDNVVLRYNTVFGWYIFGEEFESLKETFNEYFYVHKITWEDIASDENYLDFEEAKKKIDKICEGKVMRKWQ